MWKVAGLRYRFAGLFFLNSPIRLHPAHQSLPVVDSLFAGLGFQTDSLVGGLM
jgi:hypothetical protein